MSSIYNILLYCGKGIPARLDLLAYNKVSQTSSFTAYLKVSPILFVYKKPVVSESV